MLGLFEKKYKYTTTMSVEGMMCGHCESHLSNELRKISGVEKVVASRKKKSITISSDIQLDKNLLKNIVIETGYDVISIS